MFRCHPPSLSLTPPPPATPTPTHIHRFYFKCIYLILKKINHKITRVFKSNKVNCCCEITLQGHIPFIFTRMRKIAEFDFLKNVRTSVLSSMTDINLLNIFYLSIKKKTLRYKQANLSLIQFFF